MSTEPRPRPPSAVSRLVRVEGVADEVRAAAKRAVPHPLPESVRYRLANFRRTVEEVSAGGIVVDISRDGPRVAVIARLNRAGRLEWCLPKGHLEHGETPQQAALREVAEETGITGRVVGELGSIDYWFSVEGRRVHKTVHHYLIEAIGGELSVEGDPDAEAVDVAWVRLEDLDARLSFVNERRIARAAGEHLTDPA